MLRNTDPQFQNPGPRHSAHTASRAHQNGSLPDAKYRVIYADPPWSYGNNMREGTTEQRDHYPVMPLAEICALPNPNGYGAGTERRINENG